MLYRNISFSTLLATLLLVTLASTAAAQPTANLVGYWPLDDEGTGQAMDHSGNGYHGTLQSDAVFVPDGIVGGAVYFDAGNDRIEIGGWDGILGGQARTMSAWVKTTSFRGNMSIISWGPDNDDRAQRIDFSLDDGRLRWDHDNGNIQADTDVRDGKWHHVAVVIQENASASYGQVLLYVDGVDDTQNTTEGDGDTMNTEVGTAPPMIGIRSHNNGRDFAGLIDELRVYDRALTEEEIIELSLRPISSAPSPEDGSTYDDDYVMLSWEPGKYAAEFDVYFSNDLSAVEARAPIASTGRISDQFLLIPSVDPGENYYWVIDDIEADEETIHEGVVWTFFVASELAYAPDPEDHHPYIDRDVVLSWSPGKDALLHAVYFGESFEDVNSQSGATQQAETTFSPPGPLEYDKRYYWRVDENTGPETRKGAVWTFKTMPDIQVNDPNLTAWYKLDEPSGDRAVDWSGYGNHGLLVDDPQPVPGFDGDALNFNANNTRVALPQTLSGGDYTEVTVCAWVRTSISDTQTIISFDRDEYWQLEINGAAGAGDLGFTVYPPDSDSRVDIAGDTRVDDGQWHHVAGVFDNGHMTIWVDGVSDAFPVDTEATFGRRDNTRYGFIGSRSNASSFNGDIGSPYVFNGDIDDVRIYDVALDQAGIKNAMRGDPRLAWGGEPANTTTVDIRETTELLWSPGDFAVEHDVYFGLDANAVADADTSSPQYKARQAEMMYPLTGLVEFAGGPYYWRIDEINTDSSITKGRIWSFSVADYLIVDDFEDYTDTEPNRVFDKWIDGTVNPTAYGGSQVGYWLDDADLQAGEHFLESDETLIHGGGWSMPFFYNNDSVGHSEGTIDIVAPNRDWTQFGVRSLALWFQGHPAAMGSFTEGPAGTYTMVAAGDNFTGAADEGGFAWKMLNGQGSIIARVDRVQHTADDAKAGVMFRESLDPNAVNAFALVRPDGQVRYRRRTETAGTTVGDTLNNAVFPIPQWVKLDRSFSGEVTAYHANDVGGSPGTWEYINMVQVQMNEVYVGLALTSAAAYTPCTAVFSHVTIEGDVTEPQFTHQEIGIQNNDAETIYVSIKDAGGASYTVSHPDPDVVLGNAWTEWPIALSEFEGVNLGNVDSLSVGFGAKGSPPTGAAGLVFVDDIRLYAPRCLPDIVKPAADFSNDCVVDMADLEILTDDWLLSSYDVTVAAASDANLVLRYKFDGNAADSSGNGYNGVVLGSPTYVAGPVGQAMSFDGVFDYVAIDGLSYAGTGMTDVAVDAWIRT